MNEKTKKALKIIFIVVILLLITLFIIITKKENQNVNIDCKKEECLTVNINNKENKEYQVQKTIKPFLKPLGRLILDIKIREAQVKEARNNGTLNSGYW